MVFYFVTLAENLSVDTDGTHGPSGMSTPPEIPVEIHFRGRHGSPISIPTREASCLPHLSLVKHDRANKQRLFLCIQGDISGLGNPKKDNQG